MDHPFGTSAQSISASAASSSPTKAWPWNRLMLRMVRLWVISSRSWSPGTTTPKPTVEERLTALEKRVTALEKGA